MTLLFPDLSALIIQEVFVDGIKVISESGYIYEDGMRMKTTNPLKAFWRRRKSEDYELHVVGDGIEVRLGNRMVWFLDCRDVARRSKKEKSRGGILA